MSVSSAMIGTLYIKGYSNIAWSQPGGPGTTVYPQQNNGPFTQYPVPGNFFGEASQALWRSGCGHGFDTFLVMRDYDSTTGMSAACILCPLCTYLIQLIEPYENATSSIASWTQYPVLVG